MGHRLILQATEMGARIYRPTGFKEYCKFGVLYSEPHRAMMTLSAENVRSFRMRRQMLAPECRGRDRRGFLDALSVCQPAYTGLRWLRVRISHPINWAPWEELWKKGKICRARLVRGNLGCVLQADLDLYLTAFAREIPSPISRTGKKVLGSLERDSCLAIEQLEPELSLTRTSLRKELADLELRNLIVESPRDSWRLSGWKGGKDVQDSEEQLRARGEVICRFLSNFGPATVREIGDRFGWSSSKVKGIVSGLVDSGRLIACRIEETSDTRYVASDILQEIRRTDSAQPFVAILDCWDPLVAAQKSYLEKRFGWGSSIPAYWHYILVNGEWLGAIKIHYKTKLQWIRELFLDDDILADAELTGEVFDQIRALDEKPVRIDNMNGVPANFPVNREILEEQGYQREGGSMVMAP